MDRQGPERGGRVSANRGATAAERTNLRFYVSMLVVAQHFGGRVYNPRQLGGLCDINFSTEAMAAALTQVRQSLTAFQAAHGGEVDRVAKSKDFTESLLADAFRDADGGTDSPRRIGDET